MVFTGVWKCISFIITTHSQKIATFLFFWSVHKLGNVIIVIECIVTQVDSLGITLGLILGIARLGVTLGICYFCLRIIIIFSVRVIIDYETTAHYW
jgi:hypothetical protein